MKKTASLPANQDSKKQNTSFFQPKLTINRPGDVYEQEADAMANKIMRMKEAPKTDSFFKPAATPVQRKCQHCEEEGKQVRRKEIPAIQREEKAADNTGKVLSEGASVVTEQLGDQPGFEEWKKKQTEELKLKLWDRQPAELKAGLISFGLMGAGILGSTFALDPGFRSSTVDFLQDKNLALPLSLIPHHEYLGLSSFKYKLPSAEAAPYTFETEFEFDAFFDLMRKKWNIPKVSLGASVDSSYSQGGGFSAFTGGKIKLKLGGGIVNISGYYNQPLPPTPMLVSNPAAGESPMWMMRSLPGQLQDNLPKGSGVFITIDIMRIPELFRPPEAESTVQRKEAGTTESENAATPLVSEVLSSNGGAPLDGATQSFMENRFGQDFSSVRIHTGGKAAESATAIQAKAYTSGDQIVFGNGEYQPHTDSGKHLLAHELTHVVQQGTSQLPGHGPNTTIQREPIPAETSSEPVEETSKEPPTEGQLMCDAVLESAQQRRKDQTTIVSEEGIKKIQQGYPDKDGNPTRKPIKNFTTCIEFAEQTFADASNARSKALGRTPKEAQQSAHLLTDIRNVYNQEFSLSGQIKAYLDAIELYKKPLEDSTDRRGRKQPGLKRRLEEAQKEIDRLKKESDNLLTTKTGDKNHDKGIDFQVKGKQQAIKGQESTIRQLNAATNTIDREIKKFEARIEKLKVALAKLEAQDDSLIRFQTPLPGRPSPGDYIMLGAGSAQPYGVSAASTVTLAKGSFKHISVFEKSEEVTSPNPAEKWEKWYTIDGGGVTPTKKKELLVCISDGRVNFPEALDPWAASKTSLIGWIDTKKLINEGLGTKEGSATP